jgi:peptidyl-prolyl cis-trans isomerase SurA
MVKQYSGGPNADQGGDLGQYPKGQLPKVLEDQTFALKPGEWTAPIRTRQGYVIEEVTEHKPAGIPPLSAVDQQVQEAIYQQAIQPALRAYLTDLREKAFIDIAPGFVDTGASPKQTKSVFAASTPLPVKKKNVEKARLDRGRTGTASATKPAAGSTQPAASAAPPPLTEAALAKSEKAVKLGKNGKPRKIKREKIRFGQAPQTSLPAAPEETLTAGADQGPGATSVLPAPGAVMAPSNETASVSSDADPLAPREPAHGKTRYSDRAPLEAKVKAAAKVAKVKQKAAAAPAPLTAEEKATLQTQSAALGLNGDTATKKKTKKVKGAPKERIQEKPPAPPAPKPEATPIPPKSVRDNGEPVVAPPPDPSKLPPVTAPATPADTQPTTPAPSATPQQ